MSRLDQRFELYFHCLMMEVLNDARLPADIRSESEGAATEATEGEETKAVGRRADGEQEQAEGRWGWSMNPPIVKPPELLQRAELYLLSDDPVDAMFAGFATRAALETELRLRAAKLPRMQNRCPTSCRWIPVLMEAGALTRGEVRQLDRLFNKLAKLVHNNVACPVRARALFDRVQDILKGK